MGDILGYITLGLMLAVLGSLEAIRQQVAELRRKVDAISTSLTPSAPAVPPEVLGLIQAGRKIEAIKAYREATGAGLAEAKNAVEEMGG